MIGAMGLILCLHDVEIEVGYDSTFEPMHRL